MRFVIREPPDDRNVNVTAGGRLKEAATLAVGVGAAALLLMAVLFVLSDAIAVRISPEREMRTFGNILSRIGTMDDSRLPHVQRVLEGLTAQAPATGYTHRVALIEHPPNAAAVIGGTILVTSGLVEAVGSENELAFVLAHELGHFAHRDQLRGLSRAIVGQLLLGALFGRSYGSDSTDPMAQVAQLNLLRHSREQEHAADRYALDLIVRRYGHTGGATDFFQRILAQDDAQWRWNATHPLSGDRIARLEQLAAERRWRTDGTREPLPASFRAARDATP